MDIFTKQPADVTTIDIDLSSYLPTGETINTATGFFQGTNDGALVLGYTTVNNTAKTVSQWVSAGTDGQYYHIAVNVTTSAGRVKQVDFKVRVKEI